MESYEIEVPIWNIESISDWNHRIAAYNKKQKIFYHGMFQKLEEFKELL